MRTTTGLLATAAAMLAAAASPAVAQSLYTSEAGFLAAAGSGLSLETFQNAAMGGAAGAAMGAFTISTNGAADIRAGTAAYAVDGTRHLDANIFGTHATPGYVTFTFTSAITAFGANFFSLNNGLARTYAVVGGTTVNLPADLGFFGYVSATPFTSVSLVNPNSGFLNDEFGIDNIRFRMAAPAMPEPASWAMMIAGFGVLGGALRRRARAFAATAA